jgi:hypothetical protein
MGSPRCLDNANSFSGENSSWSIASSRAARSTSVGACGCGITKLFSKVLAIRMRPVFRLGCLRRLSGGCGISLLLVEVVRILSLAIVGGDIVRLPSPSILAGELGLELV